MTARPLPADDPAIMAAAEATFAVLRHYDDADHDAGSVAMMEALGTITAAGSSALYAALACWATVASGLYEVGRATGNIEVKADAARLIVVDKVTGRVVEPDELPADFAPNLWAGRFIAATATGDRATMDALFSTALQAPERLAECIWAVVEAAVAQWRTTHAGRAR